MELRSRHAAGRLVLLVLCLVLLRATVSPADEAAVQSVDAVDLQRYVGLWHEIARIPNRFQKNCARGTTAQYTLRPDGRLRVINRCIEKNGNTKVAEGIARVVESSGNARLEVSFVSFLGWRPFWGDYWILGLDEDYRWAAIGTPDRKYGWILARAASLDSTSMEEIFVLFEKNGYDRRDFALSAPE